MSIAVTSLTSIPSAIDNLHYLAPEHNLIGSFFHLAAQLRMMAKLIQQLGTQNVNCWQHPPHRTQ
jgi:hypothetical protein